MQKCVIKLKLVAVYSYISELFLDPRDEGKLFMRDFFLFKKKINYINSLIWYNQNNTHLSRLVQTYLI